MKKLFFLVAICCCVSSCDFFRKIAGRPTSADIAAKKLVIQQLEAEHNSRLDSVMSLSKQVLDSLGAVDAIRKTKGSVVAVGNIDGTESARLKYRYYIIVGTFSKISNADKVAAQAKEAGYDVTFVKYMSGFTAVALCGGDDIIAVNEDFLKVKEQKFCPDDVWIMANE